MSARTCLTIVLAAGEGTRMRSSRPKVLHAIGGRPLVAHVMAAVRETAGAAAVVIGPGQDKVAAAVAAAMPAAKIVVQAERRGTAHAVLAARDAIALGADDILVVFADTPLVWSVISVTCEAPGVTVVKIDSADEMLSACLKAGAVLCPPRGC